MKLTFFGGVRDVTGSCHLLTLENGFTLLLDCGLYQGNRPDMVHFNREWPLNPANLNTLILSHAHIDHCGRIPKLVKDGFRGNIYCTPATRDLAHILLLDSAAIQENDAIFHRKRQSRDASYEDRDFLEPLYSEKDVLNALRQFITVDYDRWFSVEKDIRCCFTDAGHILGSASIALYIREGETEKRLGFSGDIGRPARPILRDPQPIPPVEHLLCESTYGDREHPAAPAEREKFLTIIADTCLKRKGKLIIPAFSVGRTQEIVYLLDQLEQEGRLPPIPVFVDSPLAVDATRIYAAHPECFDEDLTDYLLQDENPFGFSNLKYVRRQVDSVTLNDLEGPAIIISASGMINAGRIRHHVARALENPANTILLVGYCSPNTVGGRLRAGEPYVHLLGQRRTVNARVEIMDSFSAHGDNLEILEFLKNQKGHLKALFLVHGEPQAKTTFAELLKHYGFPEPHIPDLGQVFEL